eukprot:TRINITY_DN10457_c0_g1_i1.p3 TRINITY_DN10457_c0_g1~~TRINITY_DN10457_c0_g1_i1.p3  ORF type:complete len:186 (+),score=74.46 TRINITY_DN10457_c0_g1_i1:1157-1714(+)
MLRCTRYVRNSLWKADMLQTRKEWARRRNPKLDKRARPLELLPGATLGTSLKLGFFILGLAAIIAWANNRAYDKLRTEKVNVKGALQHQRETKKILQSDEAAEAKFLTTRERIEQMMERLKEETNDWDTSKIQNVSIARPPEGLTVENLRETTMGFQSLEKGRGRVSALDEQLQKQREALEKQDD